MKPRTRKVGRPTKLTPEIKERLLEKIRIGLYYESACTYAGIDYTTFRHWMRQGEEDKNGEYFNFFNAIKAAEAQAEIHAVELWQKQMPQDWRAVQAFLERRFPERWGKRERVELSGPGGAPIQIDEIRERLIRKFNELNLESESGEQEGTV